MDTVTLVRNKNIPIVGINFGRLGFLASIGREEVANAVKALARRSYIIDKRALVHLDANIPLFGEVPYALNEFAIHKQDTAPMVKIHTYLNGELLNTYWADGLILATPTGSTGYSFSCRSGCFSRHIEFCTYSYCTTQFKRSPHSDSRQYHHFL